MPKYSIVIPVYNRADTLPRCLNSILQQAEQDLEVIVVDDGSTDATPQLCRQYAAQDPRVKAIQGTHGGASAARNLALEHCQGEWVTFVDSDDAVAPGYFDLGECEEADLVVQRCRYVGEGCDEAELQRGAHAGDNFRSFMQQHAHLSIMRMVAAKFLKRGIIERIGLRFDTGVKYGEDSLFMLQYFTHCRSLWVCNGAEYIYYRPDQDYQSKYVLTEAEYLHLVQRFDSTYAALPFRCPELADLFADHMYRKVENYQSPACKLRIYSHPAFTALRRYGNRPQAWSMTARYAIFDLLGKWRKCEASYGPWLYYAALTCCALAMGWWWQPLLPQWAATLQPHLPAVVRVLCCLRLLTMAVRSPRYSAAALGLFVLLRAGRALCGMDDLLTSALLIMASRHSKARVAGWILAAFTTIHLLSAPAGCLAGWLPDVAKHRYGLTGHSWGTGNPNTLGALAMMAGMLWLWLGRVRDVRWLTAACLLLAVVITCTTLSLTSAIAMLLIPLLYGLTRGSTIGLAGRTAVAALPWLCLLTSVVLMWHYGPTDGDTTFASRFGMPAIAYRDYGLSWMGQYCGHIDWNEAQRLHVEAFCIDNMYLRLLLYYGIVPASIALAYSSYALHRLWTQGDRLLAVMAVSFLAVGFMEFYPALSYWNFTLLCILGHSANPHPQTHA